MVRLALVALLSLLAVAPAIGQEDVACVQRGLARSGHDAGPVDGSLGQRSRDAAAAFAATTRFPMPELSRATAAEWCAVLEAWPGDGTLPVEAAEAAAGPAAAFLNTADDALPVGIRFGETVPLPWRRLLLTDLAWLNGLGTLEGSEDLAAMYGLAGPVSGSGLVAWLVSHVAEIGVAECPRRWAKQTPDHRRYDVILACSEPGTVLAFVPYRENTGLRFDYVGREAVIGGASPRVMYVDATLFEPQTAFFGEPVLRGRMHRLTTLFHEAFHLDKAPGHVACIRDALFARQIEFGLFDYETGAEDCDSSRFHSAYAAEAMLAELVSRNCRCSAAERAEVLDVGTDLWLHVQTRLPAPIRVSAPGHPEGLEVTAVPSRRFFAAYERLSKLAVEAGAATREQATLAPARQVVRQIEAALAGDPDLLAAWQGRPREREPAALSPWAPVWLARALRSDPDGYNLPNAWVVPCEATPAGCSAGFATSPGSEIAVSVPPRMRSTWGFVEVDAPGAQAITIKALHLDGGAKFGLYRYDPAWDGLIEMASAGAGQVLRFDGAVDPGTYYLRVIAGEVPLKDFSVRVTVSAIAALPAKRP